MHRSLVAMIALGGLVACRPYDAHAPLADQAGLRPASTYARYGTEQAEAVAIGRSLAQWYGGNTPDARAVQVTKAMEYAKTLPTVATVVPDTLGYRLTITFKSGWRTAVVPIDDGVKPEDTPGVSGAK